MKFGMEVQNASNTTWQFPTAIVRDDVPFRAVVLPVMGEVPKYKVQDLANTM